MTFLVSRRGALGVMLLAALWVAWPGLQQLMGPRPADSFPISRYRMFANPRSDRQTLVYIRGVDKKGRARPVPISRVWPGGMNSGWARLNRLPTSPSSKRRREKLDTTCRSAAKGVEARRPGRYERVEIVRARYSVRRFFRDGDPKPLHERVLVRCRVGGQDA